MQPQKKTLILSIILAMLVFLPSLSGLNTLADDPASTATYVTQVVTKTYTFSDLNITNHSGVITVTVPESNLNLITPGKPVLPANLTVFEFPFGSKLQEISIDTDVPDETSLSGPLATGILPLYDNINGVQLRQTQPITPLTGPYPADWISYHLGGGLSKGIIPRFLPSGSTLRCITRIKTPCSVFIR